MTRPSRSTPCRQRRQRTCAPGRERQRSTACGLTRPAVRRRSASSAASPTTTTTATTRSASAPAAACRRGLLPAAAGEGGGGHCPLGAAATVPGSDSARAPVVERRRHADSADLAQSAFLATISHGISSPWSGWLGYAGLLLASDLDAADRECAQLTPNAGGNLPETSTRSSTSPFSQLASGPASVAASTTAPGWVRRSASAC